MILPWVRGAFAGLFLSTFISRPLESSLFFISLSLFFFGLGLFFFEYFRPVAFFFLGIFWTLFHNAPSDKQRPLPSLLVLKQGTQPQVSWGQGKDGSQFLVWRSHQKAPPLKGRLYRTHSQDLFYPFKLKVKEEVLGSPVEKSLLSYVVDTLRLSLKKRAEKYSELAPWLKSLILGDRVDLGTREHIIFSTLGLYHLLVLSGLHFSFLGVLLSFCLSFVLKLLYCFKVIGPKGFLELNFVCSFTVCFFLFLYSLTVSFNPPVQRAFLSSVFFCMTSLLGVSFSRHQFLLFLLAFQIFFFPTGFLGNSSLLSWSSYLTILYFLGSGSRTSLKSLLLCQLQLTLLVAAVCGRLSLLGFFLNPILITLFSFVYACAFFLVLGDFFPPFILSVFLELQNHFLVFLEKVAILPQWFPWLSLDLLGYPKAVRGGLLLMLALFFCHLLKSIKE